MKRSLSRKTWLWLLLITIPSIPVATNWWKVNTPLNEPWGGAASDVIGERSVMNSMSLYLEHYPSRNRIILLYTTPEADGKYLPEVKRGTRPYKEWIYELEYNRREKTLTKRFYTTNPHGETPDEEWIWENVSESAIHQVAAPMRAMKTTIEIAAYKGGNLTELKKYGARLQQAPE